MEARAFVVGVNEEVDNIGSAIVRQMRREPYVYDVRGVYTLGVEDIPSTRELSRGHYNKLVVSTGMTVMKPFEEQSDPDLFRVIEANLLAPMVAARNFVQACLLEQIEDPRIVFIGSYAHNHVLSNSAAYCASKAGLHMLAKCLAWELTGKGFQIFVVHPHSVQNTPMTHQVIDALQDQKDLDTAEAFEYWNRNKRLRARLTKSEIAEVVVDLLVNKRRTAHMAGTAIELYGGER